jgi:hypothetical protein
MAQAKYLTVAELAEAFDSRLLQELGADDGALGTVDESNAILLNAIERASADVQGYTFRGGQYTLTDLQALQTQDDWSLKGIVAALAMGHLYDRRGASAPETITAKIEAAGEALRELRDGKAIFFDTNVMDAGKPKMDVISPTTRANLNLVSDSDFFPQRNVQEY